MPLHFRSVGQLSAWRTWPMAWGGTSFCFHLFFRFFFEFKSWTCGYHMFKNQNTNKGGTSWWLWCILFFRHTIVVYFYFLSPLMFSRGTVRCQPAFIALPNMLGARTEVATTRAGKSQIFPRKWECHGTIFSGFCSKPCLIGRVYLKKIHFR